MRARQWLGMVLAFAGVAAVEADAARLDTGALAGDALVLLAAMLWGATSVLIKATRLARLWPRRSCCISSSSRCRCCSAARRWQARAGGWRACGRLRGRRSAYQGAGVACVSYLVWFWLMARYPVSRISAFTFLTPVFGVLAAALLLGEAVTPMIVLALLGVAAGLRLINARPIED